MAVSNVKTMEKPRSGESIGALAAPQLNINDLQGLAKTFSESDFIPEHYRKKPANCFIALYSAWQMKIDPLAFMRHTYVVHGNLGIDAQLVIALVNERGPFSAPINWKFEGSGATLKCTAFAPLRSTGEVRSAELTYQTVQKEGWTRNQKWLTMQEQMFKYRSATFLARAVCPEVLIGLPRPSDELEDIEASQGSTLRTNLDAIADSIPGDEPLKQEDKTQIVETTATAIEDDLIGDDELKIIAELADQAELHPAAVDRLAKQFGAADRTKLTQGQVGAFLKALEAEGDKRR